MEVDEKGEYGVEAVAACEKEITKNTVKSISKLDKQNTCHVLDRSIDNFCGVIKSMSNN